MRSHKCIFTELHKQNMRRIVFTNDKGGVGKTTTVANVAVGLALRGKKILVIDMDPQADVTFALLTQRPPEASQGYIPPSTFALLAGHYSLHQVILETPRYRNLFVVPANADLADAALKISRRPTRLHRLLQDLPPDAFDLVLIDTGKGLDPLAVNALAAADEVIVMVTPGRLELDAIARMQEHVTLVREEVLLQAQFPVVRGILLTLADPYTVTRDTLLRLQSLYPGLVLRTIIPKNNDLQKAIGRAQSIFEVAPDSKGSLAYQQLIEELGL
jgi:chromosome partitioning protein